jgi:integrase
VLILQPPERRSFRQRVQRRSSQITDGGGPASGDTLDQPAVAFVSEYSRASVQGRRRTGPLGTKASWKDDEAMLRVLCAHTIEGRRLGGWHVTEVTERHLEDFLRTLAAAGRAPSTRNHYLRLLRLLGRLAVRKKYRAEPFFAPDCELRQDREQPRRRRLTDDEEERLIRAASPHLQRLIIAAFSLAARLGELLSLQWRDVDLQRRRIRLLAHKTKDGEERVLPVSESLASVLELVKTGPDGRPHAQTAFVFGNAVGERVNSVKTAWRAACRRAGITDLRFHDLRHEAASRFVEGGWPLHHVQEMLGHSNLKQTSTYVNAKQVDLVESMRKYDQSRPACKPLANLPASDPRPVRNDPPPSDANQQVH